MVEALTKIVPWFFALDHAHYARWTPVHRDINVPVNGNDGLPWYICSTYQGTHLWCIVV